ncbi:DUF4231 domain-containing protein [Vibrio anguillarum]|uniref:DUF4231 domain-containing protein n=1 Tax=Vibrio anguillarum TaxID=55601 RepID=UPI000B54717B|nr:DUF4231 domain-containing protein [Vibrio anguillarum]ASG03211.1 hypothetical protein CEJ46_04960 [Vibrio anguillarum]
MTHNLESKVTSKIKHFKDKADHNKREALWGFKAIMFTTVSVPLFIAFGVDEFWSKYVPAIFSSVSAFTTAWLQLRKPNYLWTLYRTVERNLESHLELYTYNAGEYQNSENKDVLLIENMNKICLNANSSWVALVPNDKDLEKVDKKNNA